jgi:transcriptional regulator with GAF, ATPase, and Fis domain
MKKPLRILLVEDNDGDARLLREALSTEAPGSFVLTHVRRMNEAVVKLADGDLDVVMLDLGLPDAHGLESVRRVVAAGPNVALIVLTGLEDDAFAASAIKEGAQDYLIKGQVDDSSLWQVIRFSVERQRQQVDDRKRAEEALLQQFSSLSAANVHLCELLADTSARLGEILPHDSVAIMLSEPDHSTLRLQFLDACDGELDDRKDTVIPLDRSPAEKAMRSRKPLLVDQVDGTEYSAQAIQHLTSRNVRSGCWAPLVSHGNAIGCLMIGSTRESGFTQHAGQILGKIACQITTAVENAAVRRSRERERGQEEEQNDPEDDLILEHRFEEIIGDSLELKQTLKYVETVAPTDATVLIQGETGTGKELLARAIHQLSDRRNHTFVKLNCAAIPSGLMESELFGHEKGVYGRVHPKERAC